MAALGVALRDRYLATKRARARSMESSSASPRGTAPRTRPAASWRGCGCRSRRTDRAGRPAAADPGARAAEVDQPECAAVEQQDVARVWVGMEEPVDEHLVHDHAQQFVASSLRSMSDSQSAAETAAPSNRSRTSTRAVVSAE